MVDSRDVVEELVEEKDEGASVMGNAMLLARYISRAAKQFLQQSFTVVNALDECKDVELLLNAGRIEKGQYLTIRDESAPSGYQGKALGSPLDLYGCDPICGIELHARRELDSHRRLRILESSLKNEIYSALCEKLEEM